METVDVYTLYNKVSYNFNKDKKSLSVRWEVFDIEVNDLMLKEIGVLYDKNTFTNLLFIDEFRQHLQLDERETIRIHISYTLPELFRGEITIKVLEDAYQQHFTFLELNGDGYLYLMEFQGNCIANVDATEFTYHKIDC